MLDFYSIFLTKKTAYSLGEEKPNQEQVNEGDAAEEKEVKSEEEAVGAEVVVPKEVKAEMNEETGVKEENGEAEVKKEEAEEVAEVGVNTAMADVKEKNQKSRLKKKIKQVKNYPSVDLMFTLAHY